MFKAVLFDFDGVTAQVDIGQVVAESRSLENFFLIKPEQILRDYFYLNPHNRALDLGLTSVENVRESIRDLLWKGQPAEWFRWWHSVENAYKIHPLMSKWLGELAINYKLALITDNHLGFRTWLETRSDINQYFDCIVCSAEVGIKKPSRSIFQIAANQLEVSFEDIIYLDDDIVNVIEAQSFGIKSIHFTSVDQAKCELNTIVQEYSGKC